MASKSSIFLVGYFLFFSYGSLANGGGANPNATASIFVAMEMPTFNAAASSSVDSDCTFSNSNGITVSTDENSKLRPNLVLNLKHRSAGKPTSPSHSVAASTAKDLTRIQTLQTRIFNKKINKPPAASSPEYSSSGEIPSAAEPEYSTSGGELSGQLIATLESGVSLGSGEYFMDVFIGTPPKHFSLILDTGSDLNWIQCLPCHDCFEQNGPHYDPHKSTSYRNITCNDRRCRLVSPPPSTPTPPCKTLNQTCPYYYWYGDSSNTTGDFAVETFTVNLTTPNNKKSEFKTVENVMFGCGHWNRGLFHGAAGLLGLGRGPLSFSSQLQNLYGDSFSYCLVDRNSNSSVSSKLIFGEDRELLKHPLLNFTSFVVGKENNNLVDTFYYVKIKSIVIGGEVMNIPEETWDLLPDGSGGTIVDSGTTLSYFAEPAYRIIKEGFMRKVDKRYERVEDFPILDPCYNVSGVAEYEMPSFGIVFGDGAVWNFPVENYFIKLEPDDVVCLAMLGTPKSGLSIIGNYQQQNFHISYDTKRSRLGFAPTKCADM